MDNENLNNEINETEQVNNEEVTVIEEKDQVIEETAVKEEPVQTVKEEPAARTYEEPVRRAYEEPQFYYNIPVYTQEVKESKPKKSGGKFWMAATAVLMAICLVTSSFAIGTVVGKDGNKDTVVNSKKENDTENTRPTEIPNTMAQTPEYSYTQNVNPGERMDVPTLVAKVSPSVVDIRTTSDAGGSLGTGVIYTEDGYIITCAHVIDDATSVTVYLHEDDTEYSAEVIGFDTYSDIGVIKIDKTGLPAAQFGESHKLVPGEQVVAIGTPYSLELTHTITEGLVSDRRDNYSIPDLGVTLDLIQHSATINPGNSGGPLFNMYGQVVGINSVKIMTGGTSNYEDIGFAIQMETALPIAEQIIIEGQVVRPQIGIKGATESTLGGVYVGEIVKGGAAEKADIKVGDLITRIDGQRVKSVDELITLLGKYNFGDEIEVTILRGVDVVTTTVILQEPVEE